jgi:hypothetical protein
MQIYSIPKPPKQNVHDIGLSDLHEGEFKIFRMEYNVTDGEPVNELDHYANTLQHSNKDYDPGMTQYVS